MFSYSIKRNLRFVLCMLSPIFDIAVKMMRGTLEIENHSIVKQTDIGACIRKDCKNQNILELVGISSGTGVCLGD